MRVSIQILLIFLGVILLGCLLAPPLFMALHATVGAPWPFDRFLSRVFMVLAFAALITWRKSLRIDESLRRSLVRPPQWFTLLRSGFLLGIVSLLLLIVIESLMGGIVFTALDKTPGKAAYRLVSALATGLAVGFIEEIFFRGFVLQSLMREMRVTRAVAVTSFFYAILHYFKAKEHFYLDHWDWAAGFKAGACFFAPFQDVTAMVPGVIGLSIVGVVLALAYLRTGSLYLSIGLHAGWVFVLKSYGLITDRVPDASKILFGDDKLVTGAASWVMLAAVGALVLRWPKAPASQSGS